MAVVQPRPGQATRANTPALHKLGHTLYRWLMKGARLAHLVLSMFGLLVLLFFGLTGLFLNHPDWLYHDDPFEYEETRTLPIQLVRAKPLDKFALVEHLRKEFGITIPCTDIKADNPNVLVVEFTSPGRQCTVTIDLPAEEEARAEGEKEEPKDPDEKQEKADDPPPQKDDAPTTIEATAAHKVFNLWGRFADLHRAKHTTKRDPGAFWPWVIDAAAVLMVLLGLTGLILWASLKTRRWLGLGALSLGTGVLLAVYFWLVP
jgi:hypothetical protein